MRTAFLLKNREFELDPQIETDLMTRKEKLKEEIENGPDNDEQHVEIVYLEERVEGLKMKSMNIYKKFASKKWLMKVDLVV